MSGPSKPASRTTQWVKTEMRGCSHPPGSPGGCVRPDLIVYSRTRDGRFEVGHEHPPGEAVPCGIRVELKPGEGRKR